MSAALQSVVTNLDAPIEGWDAFSALDNMPPNAAVILDNLIPDAGSVKTRAGYRPFFDTGTGKPVEGLGTLQEGYAERLVVASGGGLWSIRDGDPATGTEIAPAGTFTSDRWQFSSFRRLTQQTALIMTNGEDTPQIFLNEGTRDAPNYTLTPIVDTDGVLADGNFIGSCVFKGRVYYWRDNDDAFYYAQAGAYQGELKRFDLGTVIQRGGKLVIVTTWTQQDAGDGRDDFIVFVFSTGEVVVYQGDDPDAGGYWEMVGRYYMAEPLSIRGVEHFGSDVIIMTRDGYVNLSTIVQQGKTSDVSQFSRMIHGAIMQRTATRWDEWGWECNLFPGEGLFIFNVPLARNTYEQHVLNTVTMRWCRFTDLPMCTMAVYNDFLFGACANGVVYRLLAGTSDNGNPIQFTCLTAYQTLGNPGYQKHLTAAQIMSTHSDPENIDLRAYADYEVPVIERIQATDFSSEEGIWADAPPPGGTKGSFWADSPVPGGDKGSYWSSGIRPITTSGWQNVSAYGYAVALLVQFARINEEVTWRNTGLRFLMGGAQ